MLPNEIEAIEKALGITDESHVKDQYAETDKTVWPEPIPLQLEQLSPVKEISPNIIPGPLKDWLTDISHRMQCPLDFVSVGAMVVASAIIGANCAIRPKKNDNWEVVPNLWGGIVARPSMLKSPSLAEVIKPLSLMEIEAKEEHESNLRLYEARQEGYKAKREAIKADMVKAAKTKGNTSDLEMLLAALEPAQEPCRRRFKTNDTTVEKLGELLNENPRGILVFRDELTGLLSSWDREDRQSDRAFFLEGWNGTQSFTTDRIGRGTVDVGNVCISILGGIQPSKLTAYLMQSAGSLTNDGMIQRFQLLVYPDEPKSWQLVDEKPNKTARDQAYSVFKTLAEMDFLALGAMQEGNERPFFRFDEKAQYIFYEWLTELETKIRNEEHPLICEHLAKYRGLMPSLALVIHLIGIAAGGTPGPVSPMSALMSAEWTSYLESHARRIYGLILNVRNKSAAALARKIQDGKVKDGFSIRDIYRSGWHLLDTPNMVEDACQELEEANWLRKDYEPIPNRQPKAVYRINPKIFPKTPNIRTDIGAIGCA